MLLVQEFVTKLTEPEKCAANARDLNRFIARLSGGHVTRVESGHLYGPLRVPGVPLFEEPPELFIGKAVCSVSQ